jgi:hypothetical protein
MVALLKTCTCSFCYALSIGRVTDVSNDFIVIIIIIIKQSQESISYSVHGNNQQGMSQKLQLLSEIYFFPRVDKI